jgi:hypothetical protein
MESLEWAREIGPATESLLSAQLQKVNNYLFGYRATQAMKKLFKVYGQTRLEEACTYAVKHKVSGSSALRNILAKNLDRLFAQAADQDVGTAAKPPAPAHENIRGAEYYDLILTDEKDEKS